MNDGKVIIPLRGITPLTYENLRKRFNIKPTDVELEVSLMRFKAARFTEGQWKFYTPIDLPYYTTVLEIQIGALRYPTIAHEVPIQTAYDIDQWRVGAGGGFSGTVREYLEQLKKEAKS